jgi:hypothetical protein
MPTPRIVLVPGFWLGTWAWDEVAWVDLPTSHWPMWSTPRDLAAIIGDVAKAHADRQGSTRE